MIIRIHLKASQLSSIMNGQITHLEIEFLFNDVGLCKEIRN